MFAYLRGVVGLLLHFLRQCGLIAGQAHCVYIDPGESTKNADRKGSRPSR